MAVEREATPHPIMYALDKIFLLFFVRFIGVFNKNSSDNFSRFLVNNQEEDDGKPH